MPSITYLLVDGSERTLDVADGTTIMQAAVNAGVPGIIGECGGSAMCATCHVYLQGWPVTGMSEPGEIEDGMLDATASPRRPESRLGCQVVITEVLNGLVVRIPPTQQ